VFETILTVAKVALGLSDQLRAANVEKREKIAKLFEQIGVCLTNVSAVIRDGGVPYGSCTELETYADELPGLLEKELGDAKARELGAALAAAHNTEGGAIHLRGVSDREPYLQHIEEAAGKFQALAHLIRVDYPRAATDQAQT
jgi:hypothetical protein